VLAFPTVVYPVNPALKSPLFIKTARDNTPVASSTRTPKINVRSKNVEGSIPKMLESYNYFSHSSLPV
jgi:hypothetical protein